jgi:hypothetical protein
VPVDEQEPCVAPDPDAAPPAFAADAPTAADLLIDVLDGTLSRLARRPAKIRMRSSPRSALAGRLDVLVIDLGELELAGLEIERLVVHAERTRVQPGFPPRLRAGPLGFKVTIVQSAIDRWTKRVHLPVRLRLTDEGVIARASVRGFALSEVATELVASGPFVTLRPKRASMLGLPAPVVGMFRGYLPLPPLPLGARVARVDHGDGSLTAWFTLDDVDEPLTPAIARRLRRRLRPRLAL